MNSRASREATGKTNIPLKLFRRKGVLCCDIFAVNDWDGFEKLAKFLKKNYGTRLLVHADGPDVRRWIFETNEGKIELHHEDPWGNMLVSPDPKTDDLIKRIAEDLMVRLSK